MAAEKVAGKVAVGRRDRKCGRKKVAAAEIIEKANPRYRGKRRKTALWEEGKSFSRSFEEKNRG